MILHLSSTSLFGDPTTERGPLRPFSDTSAQCDQPPIWTPGDVALFGERLVIWVQRFTSTVVVEHVTRKSSLSSVDANTMPVSDGASTFLVDA